MERSSCPGLEKKHHYSQPGEAATGAVKMTVPSLPRVSAEKWPQRLCELSLVCLVLVQYVQSHFIRWGGGEGAPHKFWNLVCVLHFFFFFFFFQAESSEASKLAHLAATEVPSRPKCQQLLHRDQGAEEVKDQCLVSAWET